LLGVSASSMIGRAASRTKFPPGLCPQPLLREPDDALVADPMFQKAGYHSWIASARVALRDFEHVGTRVAQVFAAQWLTYVLPCRRFAVILADAEARLGADAVRYAFIAGDLRLLLLAGLTGAPEFLISASVVQHRCLDG
jgi:hypothetical protein